MGHHDFVTTRTKVTFTVTKIPAPLDEITLEVDESYTVSNTSSGFASLLSAVFSVTPVSQALTERVRLAYSCATGFVPFV